MWRSLLGLSLALLLTSGCTTARDRQRPDPIASLIGANEATVVSRLGPPDGSFQQGPLRVLQYNSVDVEELGRVYPFQPPILTPLGLPQTEGGGFNTASFGCHVSLTLEGGVVRSFDRRGAGCS